MRFGIFGNPISHSISPYLHNFTINTLGLDATYGRFLISDITNLKDAFEKLNLNGANITIPTKRYAFEMCDFADDISKKLQVCNTIVYKNKKYYGYNTDYFGFLKSINLTHIKTALILGAGNTTKTIALALQNSNIKTTILSHSDYKFKDFLEFEFFTPRNFKISKFDLIINSTPAGMIDDNLPFDRLLLKELLSHSKYAYDVIYTKQTPFLNLAKESKNFTTDGLNMLIYQAVLALNLFYDNSLDERVIAQTMQRAIRLKSLMR